MKAKLNMYENDLHAEMTMYPDNAAPMYMLTLPDGKRDYAELSFQDEWKMTENIAMQSGISVGLSHSSVSTDEGKQTKREPFGKRQPFDFYTVFLQHRYLTS